MVINKDPDWERKKAAQAKLEEGEFTRRKRLLDQFMSYRSDLICLAFMYAKNFEETGYDITERWKTMQEQNAVLQQVYNKGYEDGLVKGRELEREKISKNIGNATNSRINR